MDFELNVLAGSPELAFVRSADYRNNVLSSILVRRGSFFARPGFGSRRYEIKKITDESIRQLKKYDEEALSWIKASGRAKSIDVFVERDNASRDRLNEHISVQWASGNVSTYTTFFEVV